MQIRITLKGIIIALFVLGFAWLLVDSSLPSSVDETMVENRANKIYQNLALVDNYGGMPRTFEMYLNLLDEWGLQGNYVYGLASEPGEVGFYPNIVGDLPGARVTAMGNKGLIFDKIYPDV